MSSREVLKAIAERALVGSGVAAAARTRLSGRTLILAYHNIVPDEAPPVGDLPSHLSRSAFSAQLDALEATHEVVPLVEVLKGGRSSRPRVAITFDDAYLGAVRYGVAELARRGLPGTVFVSPAFVGGRSFWWDALSNVAAGGLDARVRREALTTLRGEDEAIRTWAGERGIAAADVPDYACAAPEEELARLAALPGITLGSHTWSHPNLTRLDRSELVRELVRPLEWLRERFSTMVPWIAYPYGCFDDRVARAAADVGYVGGLGITGGWFSSRNANPFALPRHNIPSGLSLRGFQLRGAGIGA